ncbi:MAG: M43 family zinc metalloprotease, partial [Chitinophagales bacterium]
MILIFLLLFSLFTLNIKAQNTCGTDELHERMMLENTNYKNAFLQQKAAVQNKLQYKRMHPSSQQAASPQQYTIPVVVHVIHLGESEGLGSNIPDSQIYGAIDGLNDRYSNTIGSGLDMDINFCLATTTPEGCPTNGINRVDGSGIPNYASDGMERSNCTGGDEEDLKDLSKWPVSDYYNIWVVHDICGSVAGFAYYPWGGAYDGTVMYSPYMRYNLETLAHELGHGLNLPHTFNGDNDGNSCPVNNDCTNDGDYICDTPPHKRGDCGSSNPCTGSGVWSNSRNNYMSYCSSRDLFTSDQKDRMQATMEVYPRADLVNSLGCTPLNVEIYSSQDSICTGGSMVLTAIGDHIDTYEWSTGETAQSITVSPAVSTNYSVTATSIGGCTVTDSKTMTILSGSYPAQPGNISGNTNPCSGSTSSYFIASVSGANSYNWYFTGNGIISGSGTSIDLQVNSSGILYVEGVNHCGSGDTSSLSISMLENTGATITRYVCDAYTAPDGQVYDTSGLYTATMNNTAGCDSIVTIDLIVAPAADGLQSNGDILACSEDGPQTLSVNAASGAIVDWYDAPLGGNLLASNSTTYTTSVPGTYYAQARSTFFVEPGDTVSGGIFAYKFGPNDLGYHTSGIKGLIAAASDQGSAAVWGCKGTFIGNTSQSVGTGQHNTKAIV